MKLMQYDRRAALIVLIYLVLAFGTLLNTGVSTDEVRYLAQAKARAYSIYAHLTGKQDIFFCDISRDFLNTEWSGRCWEGRPKTSLTLSGLSWALIWFMSGKQLGILASLAAHRAAIILITALGLLILFKFSSEIYNRKVALFSALALIFMPTFFAHSKKILLDEPSAIAFLMSVYLFWKGLQYKKYSFAFGAFFGVAVTFKILTALVLPVVLIWLLCVKRDLLFGGADKEEANNLRTLTASTLLLAPVFLFLTYPWLWHSTPERFIYWLNYYTTHGERIAVSAGSYDAIFFFKRDSLLYPFVLSFATIPVPILVCAVFGTLKAIKDTITRENESSLLVLLCAFAYLSVFAVSRATLNGVQYLLPSYPFIAILSGLGAGEILARLESRYRSETVKKAIFPLVVLFVTLPGLTAIAAGHEDTYFNSIIGGQKGAYKYNLELEWSGEAYLDAVRWLNANAVENSTIYVSKGVNIFNLYRYGDIGMIADRMNVSLAGLEPHVFSQAGLLRNDIEITGELQERGGGYPTTLRDADYLVVLNRLTNYPNIDFFVSGSGCEPVYSVLTNGASLADIYDVECFRSKNYVFSY